MRCIGKTSEGGGCRSSNEVVRMDSGCRAGAERVWCDAGVVAGCT
jgi:hypothetical protein